MHYVYATDSQGRLAGVLSMRTLVLSADDACIDDIMYDDVISVTPDVEEDDVVADIFKYDIPAMPVVDEHGRILGIVTTEDAWDAIEEDAASEKRQMSVLKVIGITLACVLVLFIYTVFLMQILRQTGIPAF